MPLLPSEFKKVENTAFLLIAKFHIKTIPIPIEDIAKKLGLDVTPYNLGEGVSGALIIENNKGFIGFNPTHSKGRQRFAIAHELGHFILHNSTKSDQLFVDKDFITKYRSANNYNAIELKREQEANAFAAALLMPKELLLAEVSKKSYAELQELELIEEMAKLFEVSVPAMTYRLTNLNIYF